MAAFLWNLFSANNSDNAFAPSKKHPSHHPTGCNPAPRLSARSRPIPTSDQASIGGKPAWWYEEIAQEKQILQSERQERADARVVALIEEDLERSRRTRQMIVQREADAEERRDLREQVRRMEETERFRSALLFFAAYFIHRAFLLEKSLREH